MPLIVIDYPAPLPEWKQKEDSGICPQFLHISIKWSSNFQVFPQNENFSIVPENIGDEFSVAYSYCIAINDPEKAKEVIKSTLTPHTWCIKHWISLKDFDMFIWDNQQFDRPLNRNIRRFCWKTFDV